MAEAMQITAEGWLKMPGSARGQMRLSSSMVTRAVHALGVPGASFGEHVLERWRRAGLGAGEKRHGLVPYWQRTGI